MKRSRITSAGSSPKTNKKKSKNDSAVSSPVSTPTNSKNPSNCIRTSGGISKSLLTPCRRMGLARNRGKPLKVFSNEKIIDQEKENCTEMKENDPPAPENKKLSASEKNKEKSQDEKSKVKKSVNKKTVSKEVNVLQKSIPETVEIFVRKSFSQDSNDSMESEPLIVYRDDKNIKNTRSSRNKMSPRVTSKKAEVLDVSSKENQKLPTVILQKIKSPDVENAWSISSTNGKSEGSENSNCKDQLFKEENKIQNNAKKIKSSESVNKKIGNSEKPDKELKEPTVVELKKRSLTSKESDFYESKSDKSKKDERNCVSLGSTPKKKNKKDQLTKGEDETRKRCDKSEDSNDNVCKLSNKQNKSEESHENVCKLSNKQNKSDGDLLKIKDKSQNAPKTSKSVDNVVLLKSNSSGVVSVPSSQSSMYSYHSDDDFEDKTILDRKTYNKKSKKTKLQTNKSKTSIGKDITQKDLDEIQERIKVKEDKLKMINESPRKGLTVVELEELIVAWRGGCQKALEELLELSKSRGTMKSDADMEDLLRALRIPHDLVKYDPDQMVFE